MPKTYTETIEQRCRRFVREGDAAADAAIKGDFSLMRRWYKENWPEQPMPSKATMLENAKRVIANRGFAGWA